MTRLWPPVCSRIFLECPGCGLLSVFGDIFGVSRCGLLSFLGIFLECPGSGLRYFSGMVLFFGGILKRWLVMFLGA